MQLIIFVSQRQLDSHFAAHSADRILLPVGYAADGSLVVADRPQLSASDLILLDDDSDCGYPPEFLRAPGPATNVLVIQHFGSSKRAAQDAFLRERGWSANLQKLFSHIPGDSTWTELGTIMISGDPTGRLPLLRTLLQKFNSVRIREWLDEYLLWLLLEKLSSDAPESSKEYRRHRASVCDNLPVELGKQLDQASGVIQKFQIARDWARQQLAFV